MLDNLSFDVVQDIEIAATRDAGQAQEIELQEHDVVALSLEDGSEIVLPAWELEGELLRHGKQTRDDGVLELGSTYWDQSVITRTRGLKDIFLKALRVFRPVERAANFTAAQIAARIEGKLSHEGRISRLQFDSSGSLSELIPVEAAQIPTDRPVLLLIHGTASTTEGSFGGLWGSDQHQAMVRLRDTYGTHIYALEHFTLSKTVFENAIDVLAGLPQGARLHLVSHSRGGQVGELLCRCMRSDGAYFDARDFALLAADNDLHAIGLDDAYRAALKQQLETVSQLLKEKNISVEKFTRVACPVGGTSILSSRVDRWLNIVLSAMSLAGLKAFPAYALMREFLLEVIASRRDASEFPGLEGMLPSSPLAQMLNRPDIVLRSDLTVIAGDIKGASLKSLALVLMTDWIYGDDHDLVVNTASMRGGAQRADNAAREFFETGAGVSHFNYFRNGRSAEVVVRSLVQPRESLSDLAPLTVGITERIRGISTPPQTGDRPVLYILPGIMGSHLDLRNQRIWLDKSELLLGGMRKLRMANNPWISATGVHESSYADLIAFMAQTHDVKVFPFDWRLPIEQEARRLKEHVEDTLQHSSHPVRFLAHSMGGLVVRAMFAVGGDLYQRLAARAGFRFVMLGTPTGGSHEIVRVLLGFKGLLKLLAFVDVTSSKTEILDVISKFDGLLHMLPETDVDANNYFTDAVWNRLDEISLLRWVKPQREKLADAQEFRQKMLRFELDPGTTIYVAGKARQTVVSMGFDSSKPRRPLVFYATDHGDGSVPWSTGVPDGIKPIFTDAEHGELPAYQEAFSGYLELLTVGETASAQFSTVHGRETRSDAPLFEYKEDELDRVPVIEDIDKLVFARSKPRPQQPSQPPLRVGVVHGDLRQTDAVIMVGHYVGDAIIHAEKVIDGCLQGRLSRLHEIGTYPRRVGEVEVFLGCESGILAGAIVLGLGDFGTLTAGKMVQAYREGVLAFSRARDNTAMGSQKTRPLKLATLLVGAGATGIGIESSVAALVKGVQQANATLRLVGAESACIAEVEVIELWQDRALQAGHALRSLALTHSRYPVQVLPYQSTLGGRKRIRFDEPPSWWRRIEITRDPEAEDTLRFRVVSDRARIDERLVRGRLGVIESYVQSAARYRTASHADFGITLFEYLVPYAYKPFGVDEEQLVLTVDDHTATIPWELMVDRSAAPDQGEHQPLAVSAGMIRQLSPTSFEEEFRPVCARNQALIIANPANTQLADLPGARQEAEQVLKQLNQHGMDVQMCINARPNTIREQLVADDYRILHIAGHGLARLDAEGIREAGMVMEHGELLTGVDIGALRCVPEVVFINCCHVGQFSEPSATSAAEHFRLVAASLSRKLIAMGAKAVVAAGWAINDKAADAFAKRFYQKMLAGSEFGVAVIAARRQAYDVSRDNTWGAYQCYGNPGFRFTRVQQEATPQNHQPAFLALEEALVHAEDLARWARRATPAQAQEIARQLQLAPSAMQQEWLADDGRLAHNLALAFWSLGDHAQASRFAGVGSQARRHVPVALLALQQHGKVCAAISDGQPPAEALVIAQSAMQSMHMLAQASPGHTMVLSHAGHIALICAQMDDSARLAYLNKAQAFFESAAEYSPGSAHVQAWAWLCEGLALRTSSRAVPSHKRTQRLAAINAALEAADELTPAEMEWLPANLILTKAIWAADAGVVGGIESDIPDREQTSIATQRQAATFWQTARQHLAHWAEEHPQSDAAQLLKALQNNGFSF